MPRPVIASDHLTPLVIQTAPAAAAPAAAATPAATPAAVVAAAVASAVYAAAAVAVATPAADDVVFGLVGWMLLMMERKTKRLL